MCFFFSFFLSPLNKLNQEVSADGTKLLLLNLITQINQGHTHLHKRSRFKESALLSRERRAKRRSRKASEEAVWESFSCKQVYGQQLTVMCLVKKGCTSRDEAKHMVLSTGRVKPAQNFESTRFICRWWHSLGLLLTLHLSLFAELQWWLLHNLYDVTMFPRMDPWSWKRNSRCQET